LIRIEAAPVTFLIAVFTIVTIALAAFVFAPKLSERHVVFDDAPDLPCGFGNEMAWLAIKSDDPISVLSALGISQATPSNWNSGIGTVSDAKLGERHLFVSPSLGGWVLLVSQALPYPHGRFFVDKLTPLLTDVSHHLGEVQYFASFTELDLFAWAKLTNGRIIRACGVGDEGVVWQKGRTTREERTLGLRLFELRGVRGRRGDAGGELLMHPTHEHVMRLAGQWSINPTLLDTADARPSLGYVADAPTTWRAERLRKTA
jgi:hypothetical protein